MTVKNRGFTISDERQQFTITYIDILPIQRAVLGFSG